MFSDKPEKKRSERSARKDRAAEIANTFEYLITAFILAFVIRSIVIEPFRIPTGSMAETLKGDHLRLACQQCGYEYDYDLGNYRQAGDANPRRRLESMSSRCPSCGYYQMTGGRMPITSGDRILVLKCIYQFFEPEQWDVVVFKNPLDPSENYIKRLIGRPGQTVEIIDGDIYIDGQISRKPAKVQNELWMPVFDNDYHPARPREGLFNGHNWQQPFKNIQGSKWTTYKDSPCIFRLNSAADQINSLIYDTSIGNNFKATYAYSDVTRYEYMPYCSDLMVRFHLQRSGGQGSVGIALTKYRRRYNATIDFTGRMIITEVSQGSKTILDSRQVELSSADKPTQVKFANVDHQLIFQFGDEKLTYDLGPLPEDAGPRETDIEPQVGIFGSGKLTLSHIAIFRDIHYTSKPFVNSSKSGMATEGNPLTLAEDQFFVLGDNSPNSADGRWWHSSGIGNNGLSYRQGIVPREYLVGKAFVVYWPGGFKPFDKFPIAFIPNVGDIRLIYGGSE